MSEGDTTKVIVGTVVEVTTTRKPQTNRTSTFVTADFDLGGGAVNVKAFVPDLTTSPNDADTAAVAAPNNMLENIDALPTVTADTATETDLFHMEAGVDQHPILEQDTESLVQLPVLPIVPNADFGNNNFSEAEAVPAAVAHGTKWYEDDEATLNDTNGSVPIKDFGISTPVGEVLGPNSDIGGKYSRLEYFLLMFPPKQLTTMCQLTNNALVQQNKHIITTGELLRFFGIVILTTKFEYTSRSQLWSTTALSKYIPARCFGRTGMSRQRFNDIWQCLCWSEQPPERPEGMSSQSYRWKRVDGFVARYNDHQSTAFKPSHMICVDESISRWYGQGGNWINHGLPMYVAIDRKPENGCEIQNAACGCSGIMLRLKLVKSKTAREEGDEGGLSDNHLLLGTRILKELVTPWAWTNQVVCADSYFASVGAALELRQIGLGFIGVVKSATKHFPMAYLSRLEFNHRGDRKGLLMKDGLNGSSLMAFVWIDRDCRYFISSVSSLDAGSPFVRY
ncbi:predicted protein [Phaeodactylum tricornutum CCAP 1055/1]|uniref:PiggyBac transposable element-derived protein domain-containing protein n=2 Tax=Phaeodactylum tricornutum TaxID=2850 RepID=B7G3Z3_PHATC|nr:predicted protein [Phaeodactylum tricornutum CCAP 1055/1]EEC46364.1 predicted protein [Phaeodactylum tricornutum CCAP 1055/1]|eukprot:XP_002181824.1 predicted protein [Phaeodactylum tricornutum CCAP 1055/1]